MGKVVIESGTIDFEPVRHKEGAADVRPGAERYASAINQ